MNDPGLLVPTTTFGAERFRLTVTIRAEHPKIFQPMVIVNTVDVVDLDGEGLSPPFRQSTPIAPVLEETGGKQSPLDVDAAFR